MGYRSPESVEALYGSYYYAATSPTSCSDLKSGTSGNNGNVMGEYLQEGAAGVGFPALQHQTFNTYDGVNRLLTSRATANGSGTFGYSTMTFGYDQFGNMSCAAQGVAGCPYHTYGAPSTNNRVNGYTYNAAGNVTSDGTLNYSWDAEGKLIQATGTGGFVATYAYDAAGQRVKATVTMQSVTTSYVYVNDAFGKEYAVINTTRGMWPITTSGWESGSLPNTTRRTAPRSCMAPTWAR